MSNDDFDFFDENAPEEGYELAGVIAFYEEPDTENGAFKTFLTGEIPENPQDLQGMKAFILNVQVMMEEYLDSEIH